MSDSGISAELAGEEVDDVEADNITNVVEPAVRPSTMPLKLDLISEHSIEPTVLPTSQSKEEEEVADAEAKTAVRPSTIPLKRISQPSIESPLLLVPNNSSATGVLFNELHREDLSPASGVSNVERSDSNVSAGTAEKGRILAGLIEGHKKKDRQWEPSGRYHANLANLEEGISNQLSRKKKAREDARKVLEMFLEKSLSGDPDFRPSGRYCSQRASKKFQSEGRSSTKRDVTSAEESSPTVPLPITLRVVSPVIERRPLSTINQVESAAERGSDLSAVSHQRDSYYFAVNDSDNDCISELKDALQHVRLASVESDGFAHIPPIPIENIMEVTESGAVVETAIESTEDGLLIHKHSERERVVSSNTSLSSILDDGGLTDLHLRNRKKKSFFTRASERLQHMFHRTARSVERAESRSESEADRHLVKPPNRKKKRKLNFSKKKNSSEVVETKLLQSHQHRMKLKTTAHITPSGTGFNEEIWRDNGSPQGIVGKGKASTLPSWDANAKATKKAEKDKEKAKERWDKSMKELMKEAKSAKKPNRSESTRSNDSILRFLSVRKSNKSESPKVDRREKSSFSLKKWKKKGESEGRPPMPPDVREVVSSYRPVKPETQPPASKDNLLHIPLDSAQQRSLSAGEIAVAVSRDAQNDKAGTSLRLTPQHLRSRSAQDTSDIFYSFSNDSSEPSRPSSSPTKPPGQQANLVGSSSSISKENKRHYVPRSQQISSPALPHRHRRHTAQMGLDDLPTIASAGVSSKLSLSGAPSNSVEIPMEVDASISRTQSLNIRKDGKKTLKTVVSVEEVVSLGRSKRKEASVDVDTDSEIERIQRIPFKKRTKEEQDNLYRHIAGKISMMVPLLELDTGPASASETPMESHGDIPSASNADSSDQSSTFVTARSESTSPTFHQSLELHTIRNGHVTGTFAMDRLSEGAEPLPPNTSLSETSHTKTNIAALGAYFRDKGDDVYESNPTLSNLSNYEVFAELADGVMREQQASFWGQIAGVFGVTLNVVKVVGKTTKYASQVKENALRYIEDNLANYILRNGGWDSVLEESNSEID
ncbi:uncharacterized protein [Watersipora subatra]|uniref:uncharacterized protein isoform X3 n=1 Tax=Watersipora subatra TaxID=2589382 RepID=UPI00355C37A4